MQPLSLSSEC